jgi:hypothetical protein
MRREGQLKAVEPPAAASVPMGVNDPKPSATVPRTGRRNRLKPPFTLRQRGASSFRHYKARIAPARGPPLCAAAGAEHELTANPALSPIPANPAGVVRRPFPEVRYATASAGIAPPREPGNAVVSDIPA